MVSFDLNIYSSLLSKYQPRIIKKGQGMVLSVIHMTFVLNADIMLNSDSEFDRSKMARRRLEALREILTERGLIEESDCRI